MTLTIFNFNIQNNFKIKNYDGGNFPKILAKLINKEKPDIICTQELTDNYQLQLQKYLNNYVFTGKNRFNAKNPFFNYFGETNAIITNQKIYKTKTYSLSKNINKIGKRILLSLFPRIATITTIEKDYQKITIINTHLDHLTNIAKKSN